MKPKQAVLYARFSPRPKAKVEDCDSIEKQLERLRAWCVATGTEIARRKEEPAEYWDEAKSGKSTEDREGLDKALKHACKIKGVLVAYDLSRLTRKVGDASTILERLRRSDADLVLLVERMDTTTPIGRCMYHIMASFAQLYREQGSARTSSAMIEHQHNGRRMGRADRVPFGFKVHRDNPDLIVPDDIEQDIIKQIVALRASGLTHRAICEALDAEGVKLRGKPWKGRHGLIYTILRRVEG